MLIKFPTQQITSEILPDGLVKLMDRPDAAILVHTLETSLDCAGNGPAAADAVHLHRVSVHARLRRIEDVAGVSLADGQERLALHLKGIKLARLAGLLPT
ncbi:MAG: helix-turn-helix domain-containing protein [Candidatus Dormibacteria bacterium]